MSGIGKIAFEHLKYNHANNHDNIVTIFFRYSENQKNSRQKSLLRTKVITFLRKQGQVFGADSPCHKHESSNSAYLLT